MSDFTAVRFPGLHLEKDAGTNALGTTPAGSRPDQVDDETLVYRLSAGDREACSWLFKRFAPSVRNVGRRILKNDAEADDLVQEVFLYLHRKALLFNSSKGSARSWIFQVAYTQAFLRRRELRASGFYSSGIRDSSSDIEPRTSSHAQYDSTLEALFGRTNWRRVLDALTLEQKETLRLHFFEGYTFAEIAEKLGQSYANVRNHHYRGLEKLRKHINEEELDVG
jgi:RNA polymerase sigma-70 factor (ECF subfamily)